MTEVPAWLLAQYRKVVKRYSVASPPPPEPEKENPRIGRQRTDTSPLRPYSIEEIARLPPGLIIIGTLRKMPLAPGARICRSKKLSFIFTTL